MKKPMWTLDDARSIVKDIQIPMRDFGYHVALGGGVLNIGRSFHDLDIYFLPLDDIDSPLRADDAVLWLIPRWGDAQPITDPEYGASLHYSHKLKFWLPTKQRIDLFIVRGGLPL
jgi:hypothetical protein